MSSLAPMPPSGAPPVFPVGLVRRAGAQLLGSIAAIAILLCAALPPLYRTLFALGPEDGAAVARAITWLVPLIAGAVGLAATGQLRAARRDASPEQARARLLTLPRRLAGFVLACGAAAILSAVGASLAGGALSVPTSIGLSLCSAAVLALVVVPLYALARTVVAPAARQLGSEAAPPSARLSIATQLGYTIAAIAAITVVPGAVIGAAQLDAAALEATRARAAASAARLVIAAEPLEVLEATALVTGTSLAGGARSLVRAASGALIPEDLAEELAGRPFVELPLRGRLRGGALRVVYPTERSPRAPLVLATLLLFGATLALARVVGRRTGREIGRVSLQLDRVARGSSPPPVGRLETAELHRLTAAVNRLFERVQRITLQSFVAAERTEEARRLKSRFLANMSHDLRSPLNSILGFSDLLLRGLEGPVTSTQRGHLEEIHRTGSALLRLLTELLDTAKAESGRMELQRQGTAAAELLAQALKEARRGRSAASGDRLALELQPGLGPIHVDPLRLAQTVTHLLNHALDAAPEGPIILRAREGQRDEVRTLELELHYQGRLAGQELEHLFDGFRRVPGRPGLQLALPLVRRLLELQGGSIEPKNLAPPCLGLTLPVGIRRDRRPASRRARLGID